jgi:hypothetical protein
VQRYCFFLIHPNSHFFRRFCPMSSCYYSVTYKLGPDLLALIHFYNSQLLDNHVKHANLFHE